MTTDVRTKLNERKAAIAAAKLERADEYAAAYMDLVNAVASDQETDPDETIDVLLNANKTENDLHADAAKLVTRRKEFALVEQRPAFETKAAALERQLADKRGAMNAAVAKMRAEISALELQFADCQNGITKAVGAERALVETCWEHTRRKERVIRDELQSLTPARLNLEDNIRSATATLLNATRLAEQEGAPPTQKTHNAAVAKFQKQEIARYEKQLAGLEEQRLALDGELTKIHEEKLRP